MEERIQVIIFKEVVKMNEWLESIHPSDVKDIKPSDNESFLVVYKTTVKIKK